MITNLVNAIKAEDYQSILDAFVNGLKDLFEYIYKMLGIEVAE